MHVPDLTIMSDSMQATRSRQKDADTDIRKQVEESLEVQNALEAIVESEEDQFGPKEPHPPGRTPGVPMSLVEERNNFIVGLWKMGLSPKTIQQNVNKQNATKGWGTITHERSVRRIISEQYQKLQPAVKDQRLYYEGLKEAVFDQQEMMAEELAQYIRDRNKDKSNPWKPFEYVAALSELGKLRQSMIENRNWNASRMNPLLAIQNNSMQINVFEQNRSEVIAHEEKRKEVIDYIDSFLDES